MKSKLYHKIVGTGPPLVMLHGWGWNASVWEPLIPELSQYFQLVLIDLPGSGKSALSIPEYRVDYLAPLLLACVPDNALWLGWSLGGMLAWQIAIHHPEKISKLITVASSPRFVATETWPGVPENTLTRFSHSLKTNYEKTLMDFLELQLRSKSVPSHLLHSLQTQLFAGQQPDVNVTGLLTALKYLQVTDLRDELTKVQCASLHIFGKLDRLVSPKIAHLIPLPAQTAVIEGAAHLPFLSHQKTFIDLIKQFALT